jgi:hypothetical protein
MCKVRLFYEVGYGVGSVGNFIEEKSCEYKYV